MRVVRRRLEEWETAPRQPFTLIFQGHPTDLLLEGCYTFDIEDGRSFELYIMPIHTPASDHQNYQACFN
jgi:glyoxylase-like metal-dependent hydrolase (beta-lactamase superfamily II)